MCDDRNKDIILIAVENWELARTSSAFGIKIRQPSPTHRLSLVDRVEISRIKFDFLERKNSLQN